MKVCCQVSVAATGGSHSCEIKSNKPSIVQEYKHWRVFDNIESTQYPVCTIEPYSRHHLSSTGTLLGASSEDTSFVVQNL